MVLHTHQRRQQQVERAQVTGVDLIERAVVEVLESRRMLSVAPVAEPDEFALNSPTRADVDVAPTPGPLAADEGMWPIGRVFYEYEIGPGETRSEMSGHASYGSGTVRGGTWNVAQSMSIGPAAQLRVAEGGRLLVGWWLSLASTGGRADMTVDGPGTVVQSGRFISVGSEDGSARLNIGDGATLNTGEWASVGDSGSSHDPEQKGGVGRVVVEGQNSTWNVNQWMSIGSGIVGSVQVLDGARVAVREWADLGTGHGRGRLEVGKGAVFSTVGELRLSQPFAHTGEATLVLRDGGEVKAGMIRNYVGARIAGDGTLRLEKRFPTADAMLENYGHISPGASIGQLTVAGGPLIQVARGELEFDIAGTERGVSYDALDVSQHVVAGGKLIVDFNGYSPKAGEAFELIRAGRIDSVFRMVEVRGLAAGFQHRIEQEGGVLTLVAVNDGTALPAPTPPELRGVLENDGDADGDAIRAVLTERPEHGTVTLYADGSFSYVAGPTFETFGGVDHFTYKVSDGVLESEEVTVTIRDPAPVAEDDTYEVQEDDTLTTDQSVMENDTDNGMLQRPRVVETVKHGTLVLYGTGTWTYTPEANFTGIDTFTYVVSDGHRDSNVATVTIHVTPVNDAPTARPNAKRMEGAGPSLVFAASDLTSNDEDIDGDELTVASVSAIDSTHGTVSLSDGQVTYTPERGFVGDATFVYTIDDGHGGTSSATVTVTRVEPPPVITPGQAHGAGSINGRKQRFGFNVRGRERDQGTVTYDGRLVFADVGRRVVFLSDPIRQVTFDGNRATFSGTGRVNGRPGYSFEVEVVDGAETSGAMDTFRIRITGPQGFTYESSGTLDRGGVLKVRSGSARPVFAAGGGMQIRR